MTGITLAATGLAVFAYDNLIRKPRKNKMEGERRKSLDIVQHHIKQLKKKP